MTSDQQHDFISDLILTVRDQILRKHLPPEWDGIELRQYIADQFAACVIKGTMDNKRRRAYNNTILTRNL